MRDGAVTWIKKWTKIGTAITGGIVSILGPVWFMVQSVEETAQGAQKGAESGYETLAPAVYENQMNMQRGMDALADLADKVDTLNGLRESNNDAHSLMQQRLARCETYVEIMSHGRYTPATEPVEVSPPSPAETASKTVERIAAAFEAKPQDVAQQIIRKNKPPVPTSLNKAKGYQQQRKEQRCGKGDPLCGL